MGEWVQDILMDRWIGRVPDIRMDRVSGKVDVWTDSVCGEVGERWGACKGGCLDAGTDEWTDG